MKGRPSSSGSSGSSGPVEPPGNTGQTGTSGSSGVEGGVTVTVAVPYMPLSPLAVAVTVRLSAVSSAATVRRPFADMEVPALTPPLTDQVTSWLKPPVPFTVALNCTVLPASTVAPAGLILTPVTIGASSV